jgi:hypothetical protein
MWWEGSGREVVCKPAQVFRCAHRDGLLRWLGERLAFVDDIDRQHLQRFVAGDLEPSVRDIALIDPDIAGQGWNLLAIRQHQRRTLEHIDDFLSVMGMPRQPFRRCEILLKTVSAE